MNIVTILGRKLTVMATPDVQTDPNLDDTVAPEMYVVAQRAAWSDIDNTMNPYWAIDPGSRERLPRREMTETQAALWVATGQSPF